MEPLITITLSEYNKMIRQISDKSKTEQNIELALYWAHRILEGSTLIPEYKQICDSKSLKVIRKGGRMIVENIFNY